MTRRLHFLDGGPNRRRVKLVEPKQAVPAQVDDVVLPFVILNLDVHIHIGVHVYVLARDSRFELLNEAGHFRELCGIEEVRLCYVPEAPTYAPEVELALRVRV